MGKAAAAGYRETVGIGRPTSDQGPAGHRGNDDGMSVNGDFNATREAHAVRVRIPQPDAREGQAGPLGVTERSVVPAKPGNAGGGKGPWFKVSVISDRHPGDWREPNTSIQG